MAIVITMAMLAVPAFANSSGGLVAVKTDEGVFLSRNMTAPVVVNERTLVPVRAIAEALGMDVIWNGELQKVIIKRGDKIQTAQ